MEEENKPLLSIAIATYRRKEVLLDNVKNILRYKGNEIEVVVTDDASKDGTVEYLKSRISDCRLHIVEHEFNYGGFKNFIDCLFHTNGKYVMYSNDRDFIRPESIPGLLAILEDGEYSHLLTSNDAVQRSKKIICYEKGFDSLIHNPIATHPTGGIYNGDIIRSRFKADDFFQYSKTVFPERFLARELCCLGKTAFYDDAVYHNGSLEMLEKGGKEAQSGVIPDGVEEKFYFHPKMSWLLFKETYLQVFDKLPIQFTKKQEQEYTEYLFDFLIGRLPDYKRFRNDKNDWIHYKLKPRHVSTLEVLHFFFIYKKVVKEFLKKQTVHHLAYNCFKQKSFRYFIYVLKGCFIVEIEYLKKGIWPWSYKKYV